MTFARSCKFLMPFGKHKGRTLDEIADAPDGLRYLDWLVGETKNAMVREALGAFLANPTIQREVESALNDGDVE